MARALGKKLSPISVVTGGSAGIGSSIAEKLLETGSRVLIVDRQVPKSESLQRRASFLAHDFESNETPPLKAALENFFGSQNPAFLGLVNNVARRRSTKSNHSEPTSEWEMALRVSLASAYVVTETLREIAFQRTIPFRICNISSIAARFIVNEPPSYHVAKAGLEALTRFYATAQKAGPPVHAFAVAPGVVVQERHRERYLEKANSLFRGVAEKAHPNGSVGTEADVAQLVVWLLVSAPQFLNGEVITIDGGARLQDPFALAWKLADGAR